MPNKFAIQLNSLLLALSLPSFGESAAKTNPTEIKDADQQHANIGIVAEPESKPCPHSNHPDAQWFPEAGFGFFIHWGLNSVFDAKGQHIGDLSWPMIVGGWGNKKITDPKEQERIIREQDWNFNGKPPKITPNAYWSAAKDFNPESYDPDKWISAAKAAGFTYAVLTTKHHEGFSLWPSAFGDFDTKNFANGKDLVKPFVDACRKHGLKVGLYYSPPDWYFNREFENFMNYVPRAANPWLPELDADLKPRTVKHTAEKKAKHIAAYNAKIKGQVEELLTRYGKIDLLWFDGSIPPPAGNEPRLTQERIRELQPGIVISPRYFHKGDYVTFEGPSLKTRRVQRDWAEWCATWSDDWAYTASPLYANGQILGNLALARSLNMNYLLGVGPDAHGQLHQNAYKGMAEVSEWMKANGASVRAAALPKDEKANVPATAVGHTRYLFAIPKYKKNERARDNDMLPISDEKLELQGLSTAPKSVILLGDGKSVEHTFSDGMLTISLPAARRSKLPDVVAVELN